MLQTDLKLTGPEPLHAGIEMPKFLSCELNSKYILSHITQENELQPIVFTCHTL